MTETDGCANLMEVKLSECHEGICCSTSHHDAFQPVPASQCLVVCVWVCVCVCVCVRARACARDHFHFFFGKAGVSFLSSDLHVL